MVLFIPSTHLVFLPPMLTVVCFSVFQVRWHGAKDNRGEGVWVHLLSEWGAGHRPTRACDCVELQPHLPPKSACREAASPKGIDHPPLICLLFPLCVKLYLHATGQRGQMLSTRMLNLSWCFLLEWINLYECISSGEKSTILLKRENKRRRRNESTTMTELMIFSLCCQQLLNRCMCIFPFFISLSPS